MFRPVLRGHLKVPIPSWAYAHTGAGCELRASVWRGGRRLATALHEAREKAKVLTGFRLIRGFLGLAVA